MQIGRRKGLHVRGWPHYNPLIVVLSEGSKYWWQGAYPETISRISALLNIDGYLVPPTHRHLLGHIS